MSILIPGMEMPKSCFQCEFRTKIDPDNLLCLISQKTFEDRFYHIEHRDQSCPLIPVSPHGRLIDADELMERFSYSPGDTAEDRIWIRAARRIIIEAPTVIPAEEGEG